MTKSIGLYKVGFCFLFVSWLVAPTASWSNHERDPFNGQPIPHNLPPRHKIPPDLKKQIQKPNTLEKTGAICSGISAMNALDKIKGILEDVNKTGRQDIFLNFTDTIDFLQDRIEVAVEPVNAPWGINDGFSNLINDLIRKTAHPRTDGKLTVLESNTELFLSQLVELGKEVKMLKRLCSAR